MEKLNRENTVLVLIDVQEKLISTIHEKEILLENIKKLIQAVQILEIPIIITEQYSKGLGHTVSKLQEILTTYKPIEKTTFSCYGEEFFRKKLSELNRNHFLICGIESHICVYQTCHDLATNGYKVHLLTDCISSRNPKNTNLAINRLSNANNIMITGFEMALFEILKHAGTSDFKQISKIIK